MESTTSRAASLYRDKLHQLASAAVRKNGRTIHLDSARKKSESEEKDVDFFESHSNDDSFKFNSPNSEAMVSLPVYRQELLVSLFAMFEISITNQ
jgi:hypothetical protein